MMRGFLETAGERLDIECSLPWVANLLAEGSVGELRRFTAPNASVRILVEANRDPFDVGGWERLTRAAWRRDGEVVMEDACTAGFDLHVMWRSERWEFTYRWRPPPRSRAAAWLLRSRFHLLARAALVQYPAIWCAGTRGRVPLHASACTAGNATPLITAASRIGRSTLVLEEVRSGGTATGDNLAVADDTTLWGLVEPLRIEGGTGRRMPHGRNETTLPARVAALTPDTLVVLERGASDEPALAACSAEAAARALVTNTYMAGELRRYWEFAATLAAGTGVGPGHPPVAEVASALAGKLPCFTLRLGRRLGAHLSHLLETPELASWG